MDALLGEKPMEMSRCPSPQTDIIGQSDPALANAQELVFRSTHLPSARFLRTRGSWQVGRRLLIPSASQLFFCRS